MEAFLLRPYRIPALAFALGALITAPLTAAPLCRDSKGLFTPCPRDASRHIVDTSVDHAGAAVRTETLEKVAREKRVKHHAEHPDEPEKPELFSRGHLCRDSKGLFTPCPR